MWYLQGSSTLKYISEFLFKAVFLFHGTDHILLIRSPVNRRLSCSHILDVVSDAAVNVGAQTSLRDLAAVRLHAFPEVELLGHMVIMFLIWGGDCHTVSHCSCPILLPHQQCTVAISPHPRQHLTYFLLVFSVVVILMDVK